jgi:hypothetical protein
MEMFFLFLKFSLTSANPQKLAALGLRHAIFLRERKLANTQPFSGLFIFYLFTDLFIF